MKSRQKAKRAILLAITLVVFIALCGLIGAMIYRNYKSQEGFQQQFGDDWKEHYEERNGPGSIDRAHNQTIIGFAAMPVIGVLLVLIYLQAAADRSGGRSADQRRKYEQKKEW